MYQMTSRLQRTLVLTATLAAVTPLSGAAQGADAVAGVRSADIRTREPYEGWEQRHSCPRASYTAHGFALGAYIGATIAVIPAGIFALAGHGRTALGISAIGAGGLGALGGSFGYALADCPTSISTARLDAHVNADSLIGMWQRFAREPHPNESRALARAIHCESRRISYIPRYGEAALRLAESRVATRSEFERLQYMALEAYPPPSFITNRGCNQPTGRVTGRLVDATSGAPPETRVVLAISGVTYLARPDSAGSFDFSLVPAGATDSLTLTVCGARYDVEKKRVLVREGSTETVDVALRRGPAFQPVPGRGAVTDPPEDCSGIADQARH